MDVAIGRAFDDLRSALKRLKPETFGREWVERHAPDLHKEIERRKAEGRTLSWTHLILMLEPTWRERWRPCGHMARARVVWALARRVQRLSLRPPHRLNPAWIQKRDVPLCDDILRAIDDGGMLNWSLLLLCLDDRWRRAWKASSRMQVVARWPRRHHEPHGLGGHARPVPEPRESDLSDIVDDVVRHAQGSTGPIGPRWLRRKHRRLYVKAIAHAPCDKGSRDWTPIVERLPPDVRERWSAVRPRWLPFERDLADLVAGLARLDPACVNARWVWEEQLTLYESLKRKIRASDGHLDWTRVRAALPVEWRERWVFGRRKRPRPPGYRDMEPVRRVLDDHRDSLYVLVSAVTDADKRAREDIIRALIALAQIGNLDAREQVIDAMRYILEELLEDPALAPFKHDPERCVEIIDRCVDDFKRSGSFIAYVYVTMRWKAKRHPGREVRLDEPSPAYERGLLRHELIADDRHDDPIEEDDLTWSRE